MRYMDTPIGTLLLDADDKGITRVEFVNAAALPPLLRTAATARRASGGSAGLASKGCAPAGRACLWHWRDCYSGEVPSEARRRGYLDEAERQLREYFDGARKSFDLPLSQHGTPFQLAVWDALRQIPYGKTRSYGDIARQIGKPGAARAVGMANNRNPICIVVPCHRVIGANGSLTGYGGGLDKKEALLKLEGVHI